tara:strand:- start:204 stop:479 length:276 start_codon:yes stop_codon:yes gene_type:complete
MKLTFKEFQKTRKFIHFKDDKEFFRLEFSFLDNDDDIINETKNGIYRYHLGAFIQILDTNEYYCLIGCDDYLNNDLAKLEKILYNEHYLTC